MYVNMYTTCREKLVKCNKHCDVTAEDTCTFCTFVISCPSTHVTRRRLIRLKLYTDAPYAYYDCSR
jgi:hypothetical protein